jgi:tripartite-type tricarboxylate transporter receptor subunit TctC
MNATRRNLLLAAAALPASARAQAWAPDRAISFLGPFAAGGAFDLTQRALARGLEPLLGQPVAVVNRTGAAGTIMLAELARARPDGQTIGLLSVNTNAIAPQMVDVGFDPVADFTPILTYGEFITFVAVARNAPFAGLKDLASFARREPGRLTIGVSAIGSNAHLNMARLMAEENVEVTFVPFTGGAPATTALLGGHILCAVVSGEILPSVRDGTLRLLATLNEPKLAEFPDVPNLLELGYRWTSKPWLGLGGPRGLAAPVVARYQVAVGEVAASAPFAKAMLDLAILPVALGPAETARLMAESLAEHERIARAIKVGRFARG